jgi:hypothetical protein
LFYGGAEPVEFWYELSMAVPQLLGECLEHIRSLHQLPPCGGHRMAPIVRRRCRAIAIGALLLGSLQLSAEPSQPLDQPPKSNSTIADEPITPIPEPPAIDPLKVKLGERLFGDPRLSHDNSRVDRSDKHIGVRRRDR